MSEIDPLALVGAITGIAGFLVSLYSISRVRKQMELAERQTLFQRSSVYPIIELEDKSCSKDTINLRLRNVGKGPAVDTAVKASIIPLKLRREAWDFVDSLTDFQKGRKLNIYPSHLAVFIKDEKGQIILPPGATKLFSAKALFGFRFSKKEEEMSGKAYSFEELTKVLVANNLRFAAISITLTYKDLTETILEYLPIASLVMDVQKHRSIEEVFRENIPFTQKSVGYEEIDWIPWYMYSRFKSRRATLKKAY